MRIAFGDEEYSQFEDVGSVSIDVSKFERNVERIVVNVVPLTFDQFASMPDLTLPPEIETLVVGLDPAECEYSLSYIDLPLITSANSYMSMHITVADFDNGVQTVTFEPSTSSVQEMVTITLTDDIINEDQEGFLLLIEVVEFGVADAILELDVALVRIVDNDCKWQLFFNLHASLCTIPDRSLVFIINQNCNTAISLGFSQIGYSVEESTGLIQPEPVTIVKENFQVSEQDLFVTVSLVPFTATEGTEGLIC